MKKICVLKGDGIGPEIVNQAVKVLKTVGEFEFQEELIGGCAIEEFGKPLPDKTLETAKSMTTSEGKQRARNSIANSLSKLLKAKVITDSEMQIIASKAYSALGSSSGGGR